MSPFDLLAILEIPVGSGRGEASPPIVRAGGVAALTANGHSHLVQSLDVADRAYILAEGHFVMSGSAAAIGADPALKRTYLGM